MAKHLVKCEYCGRQFDANHGYRYNRQNRRYTCPRCVKAMQGDSRERSTGMRQIRGAMIAKIAIGALFIICGFMTPEGGWSFGYLLTALVIGGALIAWGLVPYLRAKKEASAEAEARAEALRAAEEEPKQCPSCGAISKGKYCEYCGSRL